MVYDAKQLEDQMKELMSDLKTLVADQKQAAENVFIGQETHYKANNGLNEILKSKKLLLKNGTIEPQRDAVTHKAFGDLDAAAMAAEAGKHINVKKNALDFVVNKFAEMGYDPEGAFDMLDDDMDEALTIDEITKGMKKHKIQLTDEEWAVFLKQIDANSDGVLDLDEWVSILKPRVTQQTEMYNLMGGVNIHDPLDLEEKILDLQYRNRYLE